MLRLVWKDVVTAGWFLVGVMLLYVIQLASLAVSPPVVSAVTLLFSAVLAFGSVGIEEVQGTERFWCSLPLTRAEVVVARYLTTAAGTLVGLGVSWTVVRLAGALGLAGAPGSSALPGAGTYAILFAALAGGAALFLPCYFRLGAGVGALVFAALALGLMALTSGLAALMVYLAGGAEAVRALAEQDPERLEVARAWLARWGTTLALGTAAAATAAMAVSAAVSVGWFSARDS